MGTTDLLPCPFCGGDPFIRNFSNGLIGETWPYVACLSCGAEGAHADEIDNEAQAIAAWNTRTTPDLPERGGWRELTADSDLPEQFIATIKVRNNMTEQEWWEQHIIWLDDETSDVHADCEQGWSIRDYSHWQPLPAAPGTTPAPAGELEEMRPSWPADAAFQIGDTVQKKGRAQWRGTVVGWYRTDLTALGYAVESSFEPGSVQIYPESGLIAWEGTHPGATTKGGS